MTDMLRDLVGLALGTLIAPFLFYLPGLGLARIAEHAGLRYEGPWQRTGWAMLLAITVLPAIDALFLRVGGMPLMLALNALFAGYAIPSLRIIGLGRIPRVFILLLVGWWLICCWSYIDFQRDGRLYQSLVVYDMVKHAAVIEQIARQGIPFRDPFFARDGIAGYYHYFYIWPAAIRWIGGNLVSAPMAFAAAAFWTGVAMPALLWRIAEDAGFIRAGRGRRILFLAIMLCFVTGADLLFMGLRYNLVGTISAKIDNWNPEIRFMATSMLWVPHHLSALIAGWTALLLAARARVSDTPGQWVLIIMAGLGFASMFGASIWIALTLAPLLLGWGILVLRRRDYSLLVAGGIAILAAAPQVVDIVHGRIDDTIPIAFGVRHFTLFLSDTLFSRALSLVLLPLNYALEFGLFALGVVAHIRLRHRPSHGSPEVRALLLWSTITSLIIASFLRSVIINNDFGWRSILFAQVGAMIWTLHVAQSVPSLRRLSPLTIGLLVLGLAGTIWDLAGLRVIRAPAFPTRPLELNAIPALDYELRAAYRWADAHLPPDATLQHNPSRQHRAFDFGLYGHHWPAVADSEATLFGASKKLVVDRMTILKPVFDEAILPADLARRANAARADYLLFTRMDPVWRLSGGPPASVTCLYRNSSVCIAPLSKEMAQ